MNNNPAGSGDGCPGSVRVAAVLVEATHDLRLGPELPLVGQMLDAVKGLSMDREDATYSRSLRAAALGVYHRAADKEALRADCRWLIAASNNGAYTYTAPPANRSRTFRRLGDAFST